MWNGAMSEPFYILQGNIQGAYASPDDYLSYLLKNLTNLSNSELGFRIGDTNVCTPTCADDMLIMSSNMYDLQVLLNMVVDYANKEHYIIHPEKSMIIPFNVKSHKQLEFFLEDKPWILNDEKLPVTTEMTHIGIQRDVNGIQPCIDKRLSSGRKAMYGLMGTGAHGKNGLPFKTSLHLYRTFVLPVMIYGLECLTLSKKNIRELESQQRIILRSILGLPDRVAISSLYMLSGMMPIEAIIHTRSLCFLRSILVNDGPTRNIIIRQFIMKKDSSKSWVIYIQKLLQKYSLPSLKECIESLPPKQIWKEKVKKAVAITIKIVIEEEAAEKSTLKFLNPSFDVNYHQAILNIKNPREIKRVNVKLRMLTGTYMVQDTEHKFKRAKNNVCQLCKEEKEDITHMLTTCTALQEERNVYYAVIDALIPSTLAGKYVLLQDRELLTHLTLDVSHPEISKIIALPDNLKLEIECVARELCFKLHKRRLDILEL